MISNMTIRAKLMLLLSMSVLGLLLLGGVSYRGFRIADAGVEEIVSNRMPSVMGLYEMEAALAEIQRAELNTSIHENDYRAQSEFTKILQRLQKGGARFD